MQVRAAIGDRQAHNSGHSVNLRKGYLRELPDLVMRANDVLGLEVRELRRVPPVRVPRADRRARPGRGDRRGFHAAGARGEGAGGGMAQARAGRGRIFDAGARGVGQRVEGARDVRAHRFALPVRERPSALREGADETPSPAVAGDPAAGLGGFWRAACESRTGGNFKELLPRLAGG